VTSGAMKITTAEYQEVDGDSVVPQKYLRITPDLKVSKGSTLQVRTKNSVSHINVISTTGIHYVVTGDSRFKTQLLQWDLPPETRVQSHPVPTSYIHSPSSLSFRYYHRSLSKNKRTVVMS
jgi:hypothetical protein